MLKELLKKFTKNDIGEPPYDYDLLINLKESEYPKYLKKMFYNITGKKLNLRHPKTFNEKIQWIKLYDSTPLKTQLTDKVLVRDWVKDKIGDEYLKPVLWIGNNFNDIPFEELPEKFIIKANHGCKWHYIIKNKNDFVNNSILKEELTQDGKQILVRINDNGEYTNKDDKKMQIDNVQKNQSALRAVYFENRFIDNDVLQEWFEFLKDSVYIDQANQFVLCANQNKLTENYFENNGKEEVNKFLKSINYNQTIDYVSGYKNRHMQFNFPNRKEVIE